MDHGPHLIVLRGNSASGKSTVASELQRNLGPGTANIGQDHFRRVVLREHDVANGDNVGLLENNIRYCASIGYNVIVEGILVASHYREMLCRVIAEHAGPSHVFYLEVSLDDALRRHEERPLGMEVSPEEFRRWYVPSDLLGVPGEIVLDASADLRVTVGAIMSALGGPVSTARDVRRFL
ncbi:MAG: AAA family ATPase [Nocardioides sp.]